MSLAGKIVVEYDGSYSIHLESPGSTVIAVDRKKDIEDALEVLGRHLAPLYFEAVDATADALNESDSAPETITVAPENNTPGDINVAASPSAIAASSDGEEADSQPTE